jgi:tetratricopeptide (TPR) repeat protein
MGSEDLPERLDTAMAAVAANPDSAEAHLRLGLAIRLEHPEAELLITSEYEKALRLDPTMLRAYALIGELLSDKGAEGDVAGAERNYKAWLAVAPDDPKAHLSYAVALARFGRTPEAKAELERSKALGPTSAAYLSRALASRDDPPPTILADFDRALAVGGGEARIYRWRARMRWEWGEADLALADIAKALEYAPNSFRLRQLRAEINGDVGRYDLALAEFDALIALQPG